MKFVYRIFAWRTPSSRAAPIRSACRLQPAHSSRRLAAHAWPEEPPEQEAAGKIACPTGKLRGSAWAAMIVLAAVSSMASPPQRGGDSSQTNPLSDDAKLPNGKSQRDAILKAEREANLKDAAQLVDLAQRLQQDLEKNDTFVFSISTLKRTDDIEKLAKKIRVRLRH